MGVNFENDLYKFSRRFILLGFIIFELIAQTLLVLNIIKSLGTSIEDWNYEKLDETQRISSYIKDKIEKHDFS